MKRIALALVALALIALLMAGNQVTRSQAYGEEWWNGSWHYRVKISVNTTDYDRQEWPVEHHVNFTFLLEGMNLTGAFDQNSTRVVEVNSSGSPLYEVASQFDPDRGYSASSNAAGTVVFIMNGTNPSNTVRWFYVYFDVMEYQKAYPSYSSIIESSVSGDEFNVTFNNEGTQRYGFFLFDTGRGDNTSGLYAYRLYDTWLFTFSGADERTREYVQTTDGGQDYGYDLRNNASFVIGPSRITVTQEGYETVFGQADILTNQTYLMKKYHFYPNKTWFVIEHEIININDSAVSRGSFAGISGFDALGAYESGYKISQNYSQDPGSSVSAVANLGTDRGGYAHVWENGTSNFRADNYTTGSTPNYDRIGINLSMTSIAPGESIQDRSVMVFYHSVNSPTLLADTMDRLINPVSITEGEPEKWEIMLEPQTGHSIYNRNESSIITVNVTRDGWGIVAWINATLDMGTPGAPGDDITFQLLDDGSYPDLSAGDGYFTAYFNFTYASQTGYWNLTSRAYDEFGSFLNESYHTFNITDILNVTIGIWETTGIQRVENATVWLTNYRNDIPVPGATEINCTSAGTPLPPGNITDHSNGTYTVVFQTPFDFGLYPLNCSFGKDGSWGYRVENYTVEAPETNISLTTNPVIYNEYGMTFSDNKSYTLGVTLLNIENSTAYSANITLGLPSGLESNSTFEECGNILIDLSCARYFNITILNNTAAGNYTINVTINWTNRVLTTDSNVTSVVTVVHENPSIDVLQQNVTGILPPGASSQLIESLMVRNLGNNDTFNVSVSVTGLGNFTISFIPQNISLMAPGQSQYIDVEVSVPAGQFPGIYTGEINVTSDNGGYETHNTTIIVTGTNLTINSTPDGYSATSVTAFARELFEFSVNVTNAGNTTAFNSYMNVTLPGSWQINATNQTCGNMTKGETCAAWFLVNITSLTHAGAYEINVTAFWEDIGISWRNATDTINVTVVSNVTLEVKEAQFIRTMEHGTPAVIGNMTVSSTGNDDVLGVYFGISSSLDNFSIQFNQTIPYTMPPGDVRTVMINATLAPGFDPGYYNGTINVSSTNDGHQIVMINVTVPQNGSWTMSPEYCEHAQSPNSGLVCSVLINNTGNIQLNFSVYPPGGANHSTPSWSSLSLSKQNSTVLNITYDMGGDAGTAFFLTNYTINTTEAAADPQNRTLEIVLNPYVEPEIAIDVTPNLTQQGNSIQMYIKVTSQSGAAFDDVIAAVQRPDGENDTLPLNYSHRDQTFPIGCEFFIEDPGDTFCYSISYPGSFNGNSSIRGNYTVSVFANDTYDVNSTNTSMFQVYTKYIVYLSMPDTVQGSWESISYRAADLLGEALPYADVNLTVKDPNNRTMYMLSGEEYTADDQGWVGDNIFVIPAHAATGEYTVRSRGRFFDPDVSLWVTNDTDTAFNVSEDRDLIGKVSIPSPAYVDKMMPVSVIVLRDFSTPIDPDSFALNIYYTEGYGLQLWRSLDMADFNKTSTGFYSYQEIIPSATTLTGTYLAMLEVTEGDSVTYDIESFRIASGGPYDVFLSLLQNEVDQGSPLGFDITIWNKGEIDHLDVIADYWVYGSGQSWDSSSLSTNILGGENKTFRRSAFIYSNQPPGFYTLNAEVTFDPNQPPATANATFLVKSPGGEQPPGEEGGGGGGGGGEEGGGGGGGGAGAINITSYPDQLGVMVGLPKIFNVRVRAVGGPVRNVWLDMEGIPNDWLVIDPSNITYLAGGDSAIFTVQIIVPRGESGERQVSLVARTTESTDRKDVTLRIFTSREDLINFELNRLRAKLSELRERSEKAREAGFDTGEIDDLLDDAESEIKLAEGYLREELYDPALESIYTAWSLLDEAEGLLDGLFAGFAIPWWVILVIVFALIIVALFFLYRRISRNLSILVRGRLSEARQVAGTIKGAGMEVEKLREDKAKTERMMLLLESQFRQGIISKEAYESLRTRSNQRIAELDRKIRESIKGK